MNSFNSTKIENIFRRDIRRHINKVVNVEQKEEDVIQQELEEYILTNQLEKSFTKILEKIIDTEHKKTNDIGIWISGFFGSGKSHFMKMLGYILENQEISEGLNASEIFKQRTEDETLKGAVNSVNSKFNSEVLMFQIGSKENKDKSDSISDIIYREFNKERGYAETPWVAEIEKSLDNENRYEEFKKVVKEKTGTKWVDKRTDITFNQWVIEEALTKVITKWGKEDAEKAIENTKNDLIINPEKVAEEINQYVENKENDSKNNRYYVLLDEISQFIGDDEEKLLELQSIVESFGEKGRGKLWLGVTSQEKLEELIPGILAHQEEESKVKDRFPHRCNMTSQDIKKVILERILQKSEDKVPKLSNLFETYSGKINTDCKISTSREIGKVDEDSFVENYPFLPYQIEILSDIFSALKGRGSGELLTGRERTMIDVTHSIFDDPHNLHESNLGRLVTMDIIFDEISEEIRDEIVSTIENVSISEGDNELAKKVLKVLYLFQQLDYVPNSAENISTALHKEIFKDTSTFDKKVENTLEELVRGSYVGRDDSGYRFLSETERSLEKDIASIDVLKGDIQRQTKKILNNLFENSDKVGYKNTTFDLSVEIDDNNIFNGKIEVKGYSPIYQLYNEVSTKKLKTKSFDEDQRIYWISDEESNEKLKEDIERIYQVKQVKKDKERQKLSQEEREALENKQKDLNRLENDVKKRFRDAFRRGIIIYNGNETELDGSRERLEKIIERQSKNMIPRVFHELNKGLANVKDNHIKLLFGNLTNQKTPTAYEELDIVVNGNINPEAAICKEIEKKIKKRAEKGINTTGKDLLNEFSDLPYGWDRNVIRLGTALLFRNGAILPVYEERTYQDYKSDDAQKLFTSIRKFRRTTFEEQEGIDPDKRKKTKNLLDKIFDKKVDDTKAAVSNGVIKVTEEWIEKTEEIHPELKQCSFPLTKDVKEFKNVLKTINEKSIHAKIIKEFLRNKKNLEELTKTVTEIYEFVDDGNLEKYKKYRKFLENEWEDLKELSKSEERIEISDKAKKSAQTLKEALNSKSVINNWKDAKTDYLKIASEYTNKYKKLYNKRRKTYSEAIKKVKNYANNSDVKVEKHRNVLRDLKKRKGDQEDLELNIQKNNHLNLNPKIDQLNEHIKTVEVYLKDAKEKIDQIKKEKEEEEEKEGNEDEKDQKKRKTTISIKEVLTHTTVKSSDDLERNILEKLKDEIESKLDDYEEVEIEFN